MEEGDMIIRKNGDIGLVIEKEYDPCNHSIYGNQYMIFWFKNNTFNVTYDDILKDVVCEVHKPEYNKND